MKRPQYKRILLKLSGEVLIGEGGYGIDPAVIQKIAQEIKEVKNLGVEIAIVIGGGNIFRGMAASAKGMDRASADYMGMLATVMNGIAFQDGGTGNPYFTTDTTASLRAMEIGADVILKATKVDGVYNKDPLLHKRAHKYDELSYLDVLKKQLKVMDATAISLCMDHQIPIIVFNLKKKGNVKRVVLGEKVGTTVRG